MTDSQQKTELFLAVRTGDLSKVKSLLDSDVLLLTERDDGGNTPILTGLDSGSKELVDFLTTRALEALRRGLIPKEKIGGIIHALGEAHASQAEGDLAKFLSDEDPELRYER